MVELPIKNYPDYVVRENGAIYSWKNNKCLKQTPTDKGYLTVKLCRKEDQKTFQVHRLVLEAFVSPRPAGMECRHLDGIKSNNKIDNLAWGTAKENQADRVLHGTTIAGEQCYNAKLTDSKVQLIRLLYSAKWLRFTHRELGKLFKISHRIVGDIVQRKRWRHVL